MLTRTDISIGPCGTTCSKFNGASLGGGGGPIGHYFHTFYIISPITLNFVLQDFQINVSNYNITHQHECFVRVNKMSPFHSESNQGYSLC